jgi:effector-binding domain-containing protein
MTDPTVTTLTARPFAYISRKAKMAEMPKVIGEGFATISHLFAKAGAQMEGMPMAHYLDYDTVSATFDLGLSVRPDQVEALKAAGLSIGETPSGQNMVAVHMGPYDTVAQTYDLMTNTMKAKGLTGSKDMWEVYYSPPETPPAEIKTEVIWPLVKAA